MRDKPSGGKAKNPGSPVAAYERDKRSKTYGPTGGAQPRPTRGSGRKATDVVRPTRGKGNTGVARPTRGGGSMVGDQKAAARASAKSEAQSIKDTKALKAKLRGVDYNALGRLMQAKGYGAAGRKAANTGRKTLPKTK